jgi:hypothetical protein
MTDTCMIVCVLQSIQVSEKGFDELRKFARQPRNKLDDFIHPDRSLFRDQPTQVHRYSLDLLVADKLLNDREPLDVPSDGSCFFHSVSTALCGDLRYSVELRVRCALELLQNEEYYRNHPQKDFCENLSTRFKDACLDCARADGWFGAFTLLAASNVTGRDVVSVYPSVAGRYVYCDVLNTTFHPRKPTSSSPVFIMWTRCGPPLMKNCTWSSNHFVPLVMKASDSSATATYASKAHPSVPDIQVKNAQLVYCYYFLHSGSLWYQFFYDCYMFVAVLHFRCARLQV